MNGGIEIDKNELLGILENLTSVQFKKFIFELDIPQNLISSLDKPQTEIAIDILLWAKAAGGCGLEKIKQTLEDMGFIKSELSYSSKAPKDPNEIHNFADTKLLNFDHKATLTTFEKVVEQIENQENAGIFVLQKCWSQGGKYCHQRLINYLKTKTAEGKFHRFDVNYLGGGEISQQRLLHRLFCEVKPDQSTMDGDLEKLNEEDVLKEIISLVPQQDSGHTYLFYIKGYDSLLKETNFWQWFINKFWTRLIQKFLPTLSKKHPLLKLIFLFESEIKIKVEPNYICCPSQAFNPKRIIDLPLQPCEMGEIRTWLYNFSCLPQPMIKEILSVIEETDRKPYQVYDLFRDKLIEHLQNA